MPGGVHAAAGSEYDGLPGAGERERGRGGGDSYRSRTSQRGGGSGDSYEPAWKVFPVPERASEWEQEGRGKDWVLYAGRQLEAGKQEITSGW